MTTTCEASEPRLPLLDDEGESDSVERHHRSHKEIEDHNRYEDGLPARQTRFLIHELWKPNKEEEIVD